MTKTRSTSLARRGIADRKATDVRRQRLGVEADQTAPSTGWPEAAAKARYLIRLFAGTSEASDPRRQELILRTLEDTCRLSERPQEDP